MQHNNNTTAAVELHVRAFGYVGTGICVAGIIGNVFIILATWRPHSVLTRRSNYLIGALAVFDLLSCVGGSAVSGMAAANVFWMSNRTCVHLLCYYLFSLNAGAISIAMVGVDRLLAMTCPVK